MAELHVQPKRNNFWWLWLLLAIIIIAAIFYYFNYYRKGKTISFTSSRDSSYTLNNAPDTATDAVSPKANLWDQIDFHSPDTTFPEVTDKNVNTRSNVHFVIYSMDVPHLFTDAKTNLSNDGKESLDQIASSIHQRFNSADVRIYAQSDTAHTDPLALQRADSIRNYLAQKPGIDQGHITVYHPGEGTSVPDKKNTINIVVKR